MDLKKQQEEKVEFKAHEKFVKSKQSNVLKYPSYNVRQERWNYEFAGMNTVTGNDDWLLDAKVF